MAESDPLDSTPLRSEPAQLRLRWSEERQTLALPREANAASRVPATLEPRADDVRGLEFYDFAYEVGLRPR